VVTVQRSLGHSKATTTLNTYAHLWPSQGQVRVSERFPRSQMYLAGRRLVCRPVVRHSTHDDAPEAKATMPAVCSKQLAAAEPTSVLPRRPIGRRAASKLDGPRSSCRRGKIESHSVMTSLSLDATKQVKVDQGRPPSTEAVTVLSVGYLVLDVVTGTKMVGRSAGGTAGNVAANLAWLGQRTGLLARIGDDDAGEFLRNDLSGAGVDTTHIHRSADVETPILIQRLTDSGPKYLFSCPVCNYKFASHRPATREQAEEAAASAPRILFVDRASKASLNLMAKVRAQGGIVMFEPNGPGRQSLTAEAIALADILKVSEDRVLSLGGLLATTPQQQVQVRTRGAQGLDFRIGDGAWHTRRARRVRVSDSAGAGDWVTAGLLAHLAEDPRLTYRNISDSLSLAQALAAMSCAFVGARGMNSSLTWNHARGLLDGPTTVSWDNVERSDTPVPTHMEISTQNCSACGNRHATPPRTSRTAPL